jgi:hypothetical protein
VGAAASAVVAITLSTLAATWFVQARLDIPILGPVLRTYFVFAVAFAAGVLGHPWVGIAFFLLALVPARLVRRRDLRWFRRGFRGGGAGNGET